MRHACRVTNRRSQKVHYSASWGKDAGQRIATGIFTFTHPIDSIERKHNKEALHFLEIKWSQLTLDKQAIGTAVLPIHRLRANFLDFYEDFVRDNNRQAGNRHLEGSLLHFKIFLKKKYLDLPAKANRNRVRKEYLESEEYIQLLKTPCLNEEVRESFLFCCYTGMRWCDIKSLEWKHIGKGDTTAIIVQEKTKGEHFIGANKPLGQWCIGPESKNI